MIHGGPLPAGRLTTAYVTAFMALVLLTFIIQRPVMLVAGTFLCAGYVVMAFKSARMTHDQFLLLAVACILFLPAFLKPYHGISPVFYVFSTFAVFLAAKAVARYPAEVFLTAFRLIFGASILAIAWILHTYWGHREPFGQVIPGASTNGIPAYLIVLQIGLSLSHYLVRGQLPVPSTLLTCAVAFFGNGRGSLVVAAMIFVASLALNLIMVKSMSRTGRILFLVFFLATAVALYLKWEEWLDLVTRYTKLSVGLRDVNRLEAWNHYMRKINPWTLLVGADYAGTVIEVKLNGNPHIAYVRTHSFFGIIVTLLAMASPLAVFLSRKAWSAQLVFFCFIALAALRAASEPLFFPTLLDFFYFLFFFLYFRYAPGRGGVRAPAEAAA